MAGPAAGARSGEARRRIVHIITGLSRGGAETILHRLVGATRERWDTTVISLTDAGFYGEPLRALGIEVLCCRMNEAGQGAVGFLRLLRFLRRARPEVVQTWMYHADLIGGVAARLLGLRTVLWGIRNLRVFRGRVSWSARCASRLCARLSNRVPRIIVSCSEQAADEHRRRGYAATRIVVIPNGYDCAELRRDAAAGRALRSAWGVSVTQPLIGMVARWDPLKDHANLLEALQLLRSEPQQLRCILIGPGMDAGNAALLALLQHHAVAAQVVLAGPRDDIAAVMSALDLHVLSSLSEAFPNVVAEAMACGTPCVVTDVGDAAVIVGDTGWCVPPGNPLALCAALRTALERLAHGDVEELRAACRRRIVQNFSREQMVQGYERVWSRALAAGTN
jgi:glycosyltransferase involved in cell wall biosynthesis